MPSRFRTTTLQRPRRLVRAHHCRHPSRPSRHECGSRLPSHPGRIDSRGYRVATRRRRLHARRESEGDLTQHEGDHGTHNRDQPLNGTRTNSNVQLPIPSDHSTRGAANLQPGPRPGETTGSHRRTGEPPSRHVGYPSAPSRSIGFPATTISAECETRPRRRRDRPGF